MASAIPTLDIRRFTAPSSSSDRTAFVAELGAAYEHAWTEWAGSGDGELWDESTADGIA